MESHTGKLRAGSSNPRLRELPSVGRICDLLVQHHAANNAPRSLIASSARRAIDAARERIKDLVADDITVSEERITGQAARYLQRQLRPPLEPVINATGVLIHTGLGRSPLAKEAVDALVAVAGSYAPVELNMDTGLRGRRSDLVQPLLCELTGAEAASVVNNNAAAMLLVLSTFAQGREVIVSRGELVEIGGSFRLPDVIEAGGAILREVGTTNKTRPSDYTRAINERTAALLKVHTSNFRVRGFTEAVSIAQLAELGRSRDLPVIHDIGSGLLDRESFPGLPDDEPDARTSIRAGADLVLFSGDKLLGGPQSGIIIGRRALIDRLERNPLMRALRVGKLTMAALGPTLQLHRDPSASVPVRAHMRTPIDELRQRAKAIVSEFASDARVRAETVETQAYLGGGAAPEEAIASCAISLRVHGVSEDELAQRLRLGTPPVVARINEGAVLLDLRAVPHALDRQLADAIRAVARVAPDVARE
ncbi:MAG: L-seryl-tRNA(Sec) selenium transferase [Planctomycetes bacterium]|nr:L-seryl-tRNA(Sec) selenium transferase [Planctomycetota bacterium]